MNSEPKDDGKARPVIVRLAEIESHWSSSQAILLNCGEMSASELRTAKAVAVAVLASARVVLKAEYLRGFEAAKEKALVLAATINIWPNAPDNGESARKAVEVLDAIRALQPDAKESGGE